MSIEQVITLLNAGYSKEEITAMQGGGSAAQPAAQPAEQPAEQPDPSPAQPAQETPAQPGGRQAEPSAQPSSQGQQDDAYARLEAKLNQLIGLQQAGAINQTIPGSAGQVVKTPEQILGSVIAPPERTKHK